MKRTVFFWPLLLLVTACKPDTETFNGYVEGEYLYIAPTTSGLLQTLSVARGQSVKEGDALFALDPTNLDAALASSQAEEAKAKANLVNATAEFKRAQELIGVEAVSKADFDARKADFENAKAAARMTTQKTIQIRKQREESAPKASSEAQVEDTYFNPGEFVAAGTPVVSLLPPENVKVRFFVPGAKLPMLILGSDVRLRCDGCTEPIKAKISYIASQSEYTPPVIYSVGSRDKLVFRVEAKPETFSPALKPGLPVDIERDVK